MKVGEWVGGIPQRWETPHPTSLVDKHRKTRLFHSLTRFGDPAGTRSHSSLRGVTLVTRGVTRALEGLQQAEHLRLSNGNRLQSAKIGEQWEVPAYRL